MRVINGNGQEFNQWYLEVCQVAAAHEVIDIPDKPEWLPEWREGLDPIDAFLVKSSKGDMSK